MRRQKKAMRWQTEDLLAAKMYARAPSVCPNAWVFRAAKAVDWTLWRAVGSCLCPADPQVTRPYSEDWRRVLGPCSANPLKLGEWWLCSTLGRLLQGIRHPTSPPFSSLGEEWRPVNGGGPLSRDRGQVTCAVLSNSVAERASHLFASPGVLAAPEGLGERRPTM